jgi:hypothetical protein
VQEALLTNTLKAIRFFAAGETAAAGMISPSVSQLTEGVLHTMTAAKRNAAILVLFLATVVLAGGMVTYHSLAGRQTDPEPPIQVGDTGSPSPGPKAEVPAKPDEKEYGSEEKATAHVKGVIRAPNRRGAVTGGQVWPPRTFEATLDQEKHQWTLTGPVRVDVSRNSRNSWEKEWTFVVHYDPSSQRYDYDTVNSLFDQIFGFDKIIGPQTGWHPVKDFGKWIQGNFPEPMSSANPISSIRLVSSNKSNWLGQRDCYSYDGDALKVLQETPRSVTVRLDDHGDEDWTFRFGAPFGRALEVGRYGGAAWVFGSEDSAAWPYGAINLQAKILPKNNPNSTLFSGAHQPVDEFVVWEMDLKDPKVPRLAIDFIYNDSACGSLRVNSRFKPAMPQPWPYYSK